MYVTGIKSQQDVADLIDIFENSWSLSTLDEFLHGLKHYKCILCFDIDTKDIALGYAFYALDERGWSELTDIAVRKEMQGKGYGTALIEYIKRVEGKPIRLSVNTVNPALRLYEKLGFKVIQEVYNYYSVGEDAIRMEWK
jgi:ribosomal protein S18 acetylase RimI-like enzyme